MELLIRMQNFFSACFVAGRLMESRNDSLALGEAALKHPLCLLERATVRILNRNGPWYPLVIR